MQQFAVACFGLVFFKANKHKRCDINRIATKISSAVAGYQYSKK